MPTNPPAETAHERDSGKSTLKVQPAATARLRLQPRGAADEHSHTRRIRARASTARDGTVQCGRGLGADNTVGGESIRLLERDNGRLR